MIYELNGGLRRTRKYFAYATVTNILIEEDRVHLGGNSRRSECRCQMFSRSLNTRGRSRHPEESHLYALEFQPLGQGHPTCQ